MPGVSVDIPPISEGLSQAPQSEQQQSTKNNLCTAQRSVISE